MTLCAQPGIFQGRGDFFKWVVNQDTMILRKEKVFDIALSLFWEFMKLKYSIHRCSQKYLCWKILENFYGSLPYYVNFLLSNNNNFKVLKVNYNQLK